MALNVTTDGATISWFLRRCYPNTGSYYEYKAYVYCSYSYTLQSDNSYNVTINQFYGNLSGADYGYSACGANKWDGVCKNGCCNPLTVYLATNLSGSLAQVASYNTHLYANLSGSYSKPINQTFNLAPGASRTVTIGKGVQCDMIYTHTVTFQNTNSKPAPVPPTVSAYASCSSSSYTSASFSASVSYGSCDTGSNSTTYVIKDSSGSTIKSGSGTSASVGSLQANSRYTATFTVSNGCYSASSSASTVTSAGNSLTNVAATAWDSGTARIVPVNGGGYYKVTHQVQIKPCSGGSWQTVATSTSTTPTTVTFSGLTDKTCYQVRCVTSNGSGCSYTSGTYTFTTPEKGICRANFTTIDSDTNSRCTNTWADICYHYETMLTPAKIWVYYRVKDGYDPTWLLADERTVNQDSGDVCFKIENLFPNQVVYEMYIKTHTEEVDWSGDTTTFTTPLCPEVTSDNCESMSYMTEYLCASIKKLLDGGNMDIFANPYSLQLCEPGNSNPTHLTLWSRYLRLAHAYLCILCDFMNLSHATSGQYLVGEIGWVNMLTEIVESQMETDGWKLATSDATYKYIHEKLKEVWHYQGTVDVMVENKSDLANYLNAKSAIVTGEDAIYEYTNNTWTKSETVPEDFGVWHINQESDIAKAGSGWYFWQGTWNNLDADLVQVEEHIKAIEENPTPVVQNAAGQKKLVEVVDKDYDFSDVPSDKNIVYFVTEEKYPPEPNYYTVTFMDDGVVLRTQRVIAGGAVGLYTPTKAGNSFGGWTLDGEPFDGSIPITRSITLNATWDPQTVTVQYNINGAIGETPEMQIVKYGDTVTLPSNDNFEYEGKNFTGWAWKDVMWSDFTPIYANIVLDAVWESIALTVALRRVPGEPDEILSVRYGNRIQKPETPVREGYKFMGWTTESGEPFDFSKPITQNIVIVAGWVREIVTVTFNAQTLPPDAGETVENPASQTVEYGNYVTEPTVLAEDYIVVYWTLNGVRFNFDEPITKSITLNAVWLPVAEVEFDADGGAPQPEAQRVPEGSYATRPQDPEKDGCEFEGWEEEDVPRYTITIEPNVEGLDSYTVEAYEGKRLKRPAIPVNSEDCDFEGWYKDGDDTVYDFAQPVTEAFTLVAKWKCKVTVTFDPNLEGLEPFTEKTYIGETVEKPEDPVDPSGECTFKYWGGGPPPKPEPGVFDFDNLQLALAQKNPEDYFPIGTEIEDSWNGQSNPLIVAQYLNPSNNSSYGDAEGVILIRKYVDPTSQRFGSNVNYVGSDIQTYLKSTYYDYCSDALKDVISDITIPYYNGSSMTSLPGQKWFLMSCYEVCSQTYSGADQYEGLIWDLWKQRLGTSEPTAVFGEAPGRVMRTRGGSYQNVLLRSQFPSVYTYYVYGNGGVFYDSASISRGVLPACFIAKPKG